MRISLICSYLALFECFRELARHLLHTYGMSELTTTKGSNMDKVFNATVAGQRAMCHNGGINSTVTKLDELVTKLQHDRFNLVSQWREGGQTDELWKPVEELDKVIDLQESTRETLLSHLA